MKAPIGLSGERLILNLRIGMILMLAFAPVATVAGFYADELPVYGQLGGSIGLDATQPKKLAEAKVKLVSFGFVHCHDVCPMLLAKYAQLLRHIDDPDFAALFVSIDSDRDSLASLQAHIEKFDQGILGLVGGKIQIDETLKQFAAFAQRDADTGDFDHTDRIYLLDQEDQVRAMFKPSDDTQHIVKTVRALL